MYHKDSFHQIKQPESLESQIMHLENGLTKEKSNLLEMKECQEVIDTTMLENTLNQTPISNSKNNSSLQPENEFVTVEFQLEAKKKILQDKSLISEENIQNTNSLKTLEVVLTSRGKDLKPFWNTQSKAKSKKWWLPTKTDYVVSDLTSLNGSLKSFPMGKSWFSTKVTIPQNKSSLQTFYQSSTCSRLESTDLENIKPKSKKNSKTKDTSRLILRSRTVRIYPTKIQKKMLNLWFGAYRWFYNRAIEYTETNRIYGFETVRDGMKAEGMMDTPEWWNTNIEIPQRIIVGAISDCCKAYKTAFSHLRLGLITHFDMNFKTKKDDSQCLAITKDCFGNENKLFPKFGFGKLKGVYKRKKIILEDMEVECDSRLNYKNNKWFLYLPEKIEKDKIMIPTGIISLDSGIRTFQTGYSPDGHTVELGVNVRNQIDPLLFKTDKLKSVSSNLITQNRKNKRKKERLSSRIKRINEKIRNKVDDLHWKTIKFLTSNYDKIIISDFGVKSLLRNKNLNSHSKRILTSERHYNFKQRLIYKCKQRDSRLYIVDESYTSKTCSCCGKLNHGLGSSKDFYCSGCESEMDRDINAARNILIKNFDTWNKIPVELHTG